MRFQSIKPVAHTTFNPLKMMLFILFLALFSLFPANSFSRAVFKEYKSPSVIIRYDGRIESLALEIANKYPEIRNEVENKTGWKIDFIVAIEIISKGDEFRRLTKSDLVTAFAVPHKNLIVLDYASIEKAPYNLEPTIRHELYHLLLHNNISDERLPKWLDEGVSQWGSGGIADIINTGAKDILRKAALSGNLIPLREIERKFPADDKGMILAYEQSKSIVEFIASEYGDDRVISLINGLKDGMSIDDAVQQTLLLPLNVLEDEWKKSLKKSYSWVSYIADHIYWVLFLGAALATIIGYIRFRIRMKNYKDEDEDDEEHFHDSP